MRNRCWLLAHRPSFLNTLAGDQTWKQFTQCSDNDVDTLQGLHLATFQPNSSCSQQRDSGTNRHNPSSTHLAEPWWPLLLNPLVEQPVLVLSCKHLLKDPGDPQAIYRMFPRPHLAVFRIFGDSTRQQEYLRKCLIFSSQHLNPRHRKCGSMFGDAGVAGAIRVRLIFFLHL